MAAPLRRRNKVTQRRCGTNGRAGGEIAAFTQTPTKKCVSLYLNAMLAVAFVFQGFWEINLIWQATFFVFRRCTSTSVTRTYRFAHRQLPNAAFFLNFLDSQAVFWLPSIYLRLIVRAFRMCAFLFTMPIGLRCYIFKSVGPLTATRRRTFHSSVLFCTLVRRFLSLYLASFQRCRCCILPERSWSGMQSAPLNVDKPVERLSVPHCQALRVVSVCLRNAATMENVATRRLALGGRRATAKRCTNQAVDVNKRAMAAAERAASPDTLPVCSRNAATMRLWKLGVRCKRALAIPLA